MYFLDVQGTLIDDKRKKPIEGAVEFIRNLRKEKTPFVVITNNTKKSSSKFYNYLREIGFDIKKEEYLDPLMVLRKKLRKRVVAPYGTEGFKEAIKELGYEISYKNPQAVIISVKETYTFEEFSEIIELLLRGVKLYGMHKTSLYVKNSRRYPGVGAVLEMLKYAASCEYEVVGKPSKSFYLEALEKIANIIKRKVDFSEIKIISDDAGGDLAGAKEMGMGTILVLSGKIKKKDELRSEFKPDFIFQSIKEVKI
jgi:NagD protein